MTDIALFVAILFGFTWPVGVLVNPTTVGSGQLAIVAALLPTVWAPTLIALGLTLYNSGATGLKRELSTRLTYRRGTATTLVIAACLPLIFGAIAMSTARATGDAAPFVSSALLPMTIVMQLITGAAGEELGWRGFLLPRLRARVGVTGASVCMSMLWALWHLPAFFTPGMPHQFMPMWSMLSFIALFGIFLATLFYHSSDSVLPTMVAHFSLNVILGIGGVNLSSVVFWRTLAALYAATAVAAFFGRTLVRQEPIPATS